VTREMPIRLTVDGREVEVEEGATILQAARSLGIPIPTMCHREGIEPVGSCFVCVVEVEGRPDLVPSCALRAAEGMVVSTDSDEVRAARKMSLELLLSDHRGDCVAPCSLACPAGLDIPAFLEQIEAGDYRKALTVIKERIPLPGVLGRICARYCERVCRRRHSEQPIAICALKRFAADVDLASEGPYIPLRHETTGKRVAVVGAGPAGLSAAYYLLEAGHACTVFDARPQPGGALRYGIPQYRLPNAVVDYEVEVIRRLGAEFRMNIRLGSDVTLEHLQQECDAVFLALGAQATRPRRSRGRSMRARPWSSSGKCRRARLLTLAMPWSLSAEAMRLLMLRARPCGWARSGSRSSAKRGAPPCPHSASTSIRPRKRG